MESQVSETCNDHVIIEHELQRLTLGNIPKFKQFIAQYGASACVFEAVSQGNVRIPRVLPVLTFVSEQCDSVDLIEQSSQLCKRLGILTGF
jgi:hypothetical protein